MQSLANITHLIIDMDGVLYLGDKPMPCLHEFFAFLRERSISFVLATTKSVPNIGFGPSVSIMVS